ncbi:MAG: hypothetical protein KDB71_19940 [Mycobacterium sp.]|nr:hypothetical protein [Mycobacterium sp.]
MAGSSSRVLPVVRWLQLGAVAAGVGLALAAAPAVAWAEDGAASDSPMQSASRSGSPGAHRSTLRHTAGNDATADSTVRDAPRWSRPSPARVAAATRERTFDNLPSAELAATGSIPTAAVAHESPLSAAVSSLAVQTVALPAATANAAVTAASPPAAAAQSKATAASAPSAAPGPGSFGAMLRLNLEDLFSGTGKPVVTDPTAVVTGLFQEVLRRDPTATELDNYLNRLKFWGVNSVVAGLYTSDAFRQTAVNNYYVELVGRLPAQQELFWGALRLAWGTEPNFAALLAGSQEFYSESASGGGNFGTQPSATTYVNLLYRSLLGEAAGSSAAPLVQRIQGGLPISWAATQFVRTDAYRTVKVGEIYQVLGQTASAADIADYVNKWLWSGGQSGISMSLLATTTNMQRIEAGLVAEEMPDVAAAAELQQLLLSYYTDSQDGFTKLFNRLLSLDPGNPISDQNPCSMDNQSCNTALYELVTAGGATRGIPNSSLQLTSITANVATLVPTQNEIDLAKSLKFPLQDPDQLATYFAGGVIQPFGNPIVTANDGTYIVDGHHRWSAIVLINPYTQVTALDLGYVPTPQTALKEAQMGVMAAKGYLASATVEGQNLYTIQEGVFDAAVTQFIKDGDTPDKVLAVFGEYLGFDPATTPIDDQYTIVQNYLWSNVLRMRDVNPYIPDAPSRSVMPQTDPLPITQGYWASGDLSYSFPTISYLG